jgi:hypothetical protein
MLPKGVVEGDAYFETLQVDRGGVIYGHTGKEGAGASDGQGGKGGKEGNDGEGEKGATKLAAAG